MGDRIDRAFTLIELLVVISITSLLVALLLPALGKARTAGHVAQSLSNVRQLQVPLNAYASDNHQAMPFIRWPSSPGATPPGTYTGVWGDAVWPGVFYHARYVTSEKVYWGPTRDTSQLNLEYAKKSSLGAPAWFRVGYGLIGYGNEGSLPFFENFDTSRPNPGRTISMIECWRADAQVGDEPRPGFFQLNPWHDTSSFNYVFNYDNRAVRAYYDGHALATDAISIGWDCDNPTAVIREPSYGGRWVLSLDDWRYRAPWYAQWKVLMLN